MIFLYDSLSLKRVKVDLKEKVVYRKSLNPLENLIDRLLQHPSRIPFSTIEKVFADYTVAFRGAQRYYLYIMTDDPYKLDIGIFDKLADAERVASFIGQQIRKAK